MGEMPDWWPTLQAARYLGEAPEAVLQGPAIWRSRALAAMEAEAHAREMWQRETR